jgi:hypothetical protein
MTIDKRIGCECVWVSKRVVQRMTIDKRIGCECVWMSKRVVVQRMTGR